jgi:signal transduction histidine kinase
VILCMVFEKKGKEQNVIVNMNPEKNIEQTSAEIVHEIRNPLTTIKGFLQLIQPYLKEIGKEQYAEVALSELNRVHQLIYDYLLGAKSQHHSIYRISLNKVVKDLELLYESETFLKQIQLTTNLSDEAVSLRIPESQLKQVLINILNNAIEAIEGNCGANREIHISTHIESEIAAIKITDSGGGISSETMDKLFIPYYSSKEEGTGIGLYICKKMIESYEGTIHVESNDGVQTTFTIYLPIYHI